MNKKNLVVMFGGPSVEHDVSIITALQVIKNADASKYEVLPIYWTKDGHVVLLRNSQSYTNVKSLIESNSWSPVRFFKGGFIAQFILSKSYHNCTVIPVFHGTGGEDGVAQGMLEFNDIAYAGSNVRASTIGMDKNLFKMVMRRHKLPVLDWQVVTKSNPDSFKTPLPYPVIVKPAHLGSSIGVKKCESADQIKDQLSVVFELDNQAIIEPYLLDMTEINCSVLGTSDENQASVCEQPISADEILSFADKYLTGGKSKSSKSSGMASLNRRIPAPISKDLTEKIRNMSQKVFSAIGASGVARVDYMVTKKDEIYITEINTIPGSLAFYLWEASGISFRELIDRLVDIAEVEYKSKHSIKTAFESDLV